MGELEAQKATLSDDLDVAKEALNKAQVQVSARDEQITKLNERIKEVIFLRSLLSLFSFYLFICLFKSYGFIRRERM